MAFSNVCCSHIGFLSSISLSVPFQWNVLSTISVSKVFSWQVGEGPLYWYVIESHPCLDLCCTASVTCSNLQNPTTVEIQTVMATSVKHLCERLREGRFNRKILRIRKWTRPVLECDVKKMEQRGIDQCCNDLVDVDLCDCECVGFLAGDLGTCSLTSLMNKALVWYTEYLHLENVQVSVGQRVIRGQLIGYITDPLGSQAPHLHWGVGDGVGGGNIGQTIDIDTLFNWPAFNERAGGTSPGSNSFTADEICYIKSTLTSPVNRDCCAWGQYYGSTFHDGAEYYAQDIDCIPPEEDLGMPVYVASGGCDVDSVVTDVANLGVGYGVIVRHTKRVPSGLTGTESIFPFAFADTTGFFVQGCDFGLGGAPTAVVSDAYSSRPMKALKPVANPVNVGGYLRPVPATLRLTHTLTGGLWSKVPERVALTYSAVTGAWQYSQHFMSDGAQWSVAFTLTNTGDTWALQVTLGKSSGGKNRLTKLKIGVQKIPSDKFMIEAGYDPSTGGISSNCVVHYKSFTDDLKILREPLTLKVGET